MKATSMSARRMWLRRRGGCGDRGMERFYCEVCGEGSRCGPIASQEEQLLLYRGKCRELRIL